jgi:general secretion pathway protein J
MHSRHQRVSGFTLIELLVALSVMALLTVMTWRGLDGMARIQSQIRLRSDELLTLQTGLAQWSADLDALAQVPAMRQTQGEPPRPLNWNGQVVRMTRYSRAPSDSGLLVVAWTRRDMPGRSQWLRWQSAVLRTQGELRTAWQQAELWARNPGDEERKYEVIVAPLIEWQIYYFHDDAWSHPLSSDSTTASSAPGGQAAPVLRNDIPDGVRLVLTLPAGQPLSGRLTRDWIHPTVGGKKS